MWRSISPSFILIQPSTHVWLHWAKFNNTEGGKQTQADLTDFYINVCSSTDVNYYANKATCVHAVRLQLINALAPLLFSWTIQKWCLCRHFSKNINKVFYEMTKITLFNLSFCESNCKYSASFSEFLDCFNYIRNISPYGCRHALKPWLLVIWICTVLLRGGAWGLILIYMKSWIPVEQWKGVFRKICLAEIYFPFTSPWRGQKQVQLP